VRPRPATVLACSRPPRCPRVGRGRGGPHARPASPGARREASAQRRPVSPATQVHARRETRSPVDQGRPCQNVPVGGVTSCGSSRHLASSRASPASSRGGGLLMLWSRLSSTVSLDPHGPATDNQRATPSPSDVSDVGSARIDREGRFRARTRAVALSAHRTDQWECSLEGVLMLPIGMVIPRQAGDRNGCRSAAATYLARAGLRGDRGPGSDRRAVGATRRWCAPATVKFAATARLRGCASGIPARWFDTVDLTPEHDSALRRAGGGGGVRR
jgi:hypothetical protein